MTATQSVKIYQLLSKHFNNEDDASILVSEIETLVDNKIDLKKDVLATKEDISNVRIDLTTEIGKLHTEISEAKADTIKWMFIFWIGQIGATLAIILLFLKK